MIRFLTIAVSAAFVLSLAGIADARPVGRAAPSKPAPGVPRAGIQINGPMLTGAVLEATGVSAFVLAE